MFLIVRGGSVQGLLSTNPTNDLTKEPSPSFSIDRLNPDGVDHVVGFENTADKLSQLGFEDLTGGADNDFDNVVYTMSPALQPLTGHMEANRERSAGNRNRHQRPI